MRLRRKFCTANRPAPIHREWWAMRCGWCKETVKPGNGVRCNGTPVHKVCLHSYVQAWRESESGAGLRIGTL